MHLEVRRSEIGGTFPATIALSLGRFVDYYRLQQQNFQQLCSPLPALSSSFFGYQCRLCMWDSAVFYLLRRTARGQRLPGEMSVTQSISLEAHILECSLRVYRYSKPTFLDLSWNDLHASMNKSTSCSIPLGHWVCRLSNWSNCFGIFALTACHRVLLWSTHLSDLLPFEALTWLYLRYRLKVWTHFVLFGLYQEQGIL